MSNVSRCEATRYVATYASEPTTEDELDKSFIREVLDAPANTVPDLGVDLKDVILEINAQPANPVPKRNWDYRVLVNTSKPPAH